MLKFFCESTSNLFTDAVENENFPFQLLNPQSVVDFAGSILAGYN